MPRSHIPTRAVREPFACGPRRSAWRRLASVAVIGAFVGALAPAAGQAQTTQPQPAQQAPQPQQQPAPQAQPAPPPGKKFGDWEQRCTDNPPPPLTQPNPGTQICVIVQQYIDPKVQQPVSQITVGYFGSKRETGALVTMPLGVPLANGVHITVDGKPVAAVPFQVCQRREGCIAYIPLNNEIVSAFKAGNQAVATMKSGVGEALNLPISLSGFTAGFGSIQ